MKYKLEMIVDGSSIYITSTDIWEIFDSMEQYDDSDAMVNNQPVDIDSICMMASILDPQGYLDRLNVEEAATEDVSEYDPIDRTNDDSFDGSWGDGIDDDDAW
jgi:hypothetical protein